MEDHARDVLMRRKHSEGILMGAPFIFAKGAPNHLLISGWIPSNGIIVFEKD